MMGQKDFTPKLFHSLSLSELVPDGHLVRRLEEVLDLGFVRSLCRSYYSHTGQPSVDPIVIFKMMLLGKGPAPGTTPSRSISRTAVEGENACRLRAVRVRFLFASALDRTNLDTTYREYTEPTA